MRLAMSVVAVFWGCMVLGPLPSHAQGKLSAWVFGDYYGYASSADSTRENENGFWFRLINVAWDQTIDESFSTRIRLETGSPGTFTGPAAIMQIYAKDAWIKWTRDRRLAVIMGLATPPSHSFTEAIWGYRYLEKFPFEVSGFGGSRDIGVGVTGSFLADDRLGYHVMVGNGAGLLNEQDIDKRVSGSLHYRFANGVSLEGYADYEPRDGHTDRATFRGFAAYQADRFRASVEFDDQNRQAGAGGSYDLRTVSGFVAAGVTGKVWLVGRVDRHMDADPAYSPAAAPGRPYLPYDASVSNTFVLAGVEFQTASGVAFSPNVEMVLYDDPDGGGPAPDNDVIGRFTFVFSY